MCMGMSIPAYMYLIMIIARIDALPTSRRNEGRVHIVAAPIKQMKTFVTTMQQFHRKSSDEPLSAKDKHSCNNGNNFFYEF